MKSNIVNEDKDVIANTKVIAEGKLFEKDKDAQHRDEANLSRGTSHTIHTQ